MPLITRTLTEIRDLLLARKAVEEPALDTSDAGDAYLDANAVAHLALSFQADLVELSNAMHPTTATGTDLDEHARVWLPGDGRRRATKWVGTVQFTATSGTPTVPVNTVFVHADGTRYWTTAEITGGMWSASVATTTAEGLVGDLGLYPGTVANKANPTNCTVSSPPAGVSATCALLATVTAALDAEDDEHLRARILVATQYRPGGGNPADYVAWCIEADPTVTGALVYPRWDDDPVGPPIKFGTVTVVPWTATGPASVAVQAIVTAYLAGVAPVGAVVTVEGPTATLTNAIVYVRPKLGFEGDWAGTFTVASCPAPYNRVNLTVSPVGTIAIGDRVVGGQVGASTFYEQRTVVAVGANYVDVSVPFFSEVVGTFRPGGPLWQPVVMAMAGVYRLLGTSSSTDATRPRFPAVYQEKPANLCLSDLYHAIDSVNGVSSSRIATLGGVTPAVDVANAVAPAAVLTYLNGSLDGHAFLYPHFLIIWE